MNIGQLARQAGVPIDTIRYYERQQLIPEPARSASGYRQYAHDDVTRLNFIRRAKTLGFTLEEIGELDGDKWPVAVATWTQMKAGSYQETGSRGGTPGRARAHARCPARAWSMPARAMAPLATCPIMAALARSRMNATSATSRATLPMADSHACCAGRPGRMTTAGLDPVCGMTVDPATTPHQRSDTMATITTSARPAAARSSSPIRTATCIANRRHPAKPAIAGARYTCPMHPEIEQDGPGTCPICGMALEPVLPSLEDGENPELVDFRRRFWWTLPLSMATMVAGDGRACACRMRCRPARGPGSNSRWRRPSCCGPAGRSSCAGRSRSATAAPTCGR